jgi:NAD(P)H-dependent FMN reductase
VFYIPILLGSVRRGRGSDRAARFVEARLRAHAETELLDLLQCDLPIMEERLEFQESPPPRLEELGRKLARADALVIVSPEYNGGYPGVLKNTLDYFYPEYRRKPVGIVTVSGGGFGGVNCLAQLRQVVLALGAYPIPAALPISRVGQSLAEDGTPADPAYEKRAEKFFDELLWITAALARQRAETS